ncbi:hypothetical protein G6514_005717 [Epicoccum nigrum]|nr:hypothetical protein G6514_005717 [Epicoccum nigrum]
MATPKKSAATLGKRTRSGAGKGLKSPAKKKRESCKHGGGDVLFVASDIDDSEPELLDDVPAMPITSRRKKLPKGVLPMPCASPAVSVAPADKSTSPAGLTERERQIRERMLGVLRHVDRSDQDPMSCIAYTLEGKPCVCAKGVASKQQPSTCVKCKRNKNILCRKPPRDTWLEVHNVVDTIWLQPPDVAPALIKVILNPVREKLVARQALCMTHPYAENPPVPNSGYDGEWSDYEAKVAELNDQDAALVSALRTSIEVARA